MINYISVYTSLVGSQGLFRTVIRITITAKSRIIWIQIFRWCQLSNITQLFSTTKFTMIKYSVDVR